MPASLQLNSLKLHLSAATDAWHPVKRLTAAVAARHDYRSGFRPVVTQMHVAGESRNDTDPVLMGVRDPAARVRLTVALRSSPDVDRDALSGVFDLVIG